MDISTQDMPDIARMQAERYSRAAILDYIDLIRRQGKAGVTLYHVTLPQYVNAILAQGIKPTDCYNRPASVYLLDNLQDCGKVAAILHGADADYAVIQVRLSLDDSDMLHEDSLFDMSFDLCGYAWRLERQVSSQDIVQ